ncbi:MAG: serine/threonine-protein kinase [Sandaracinaceae bacterium]
MSTPGSKGGRASLPPVGSILSGRYRLERLIASGGMGAVFEAVDLEGEGSVALKILHPVLTSDRDVRRRFRRESSVLIALSHPNIVRVLGIGAEEDEVLFSVMELLHGKTLAEHLGGRAQPARELRGLVQGIADGLMAAHAHGVIHGDLKPANVFLCDAQEGAAAVRLLDFGLSKVLGLERLTRTGELIGTPSYMAPELLTGRGEPDERIDLYAFGVMLYEALSGRRAYADKVPGKLMMDIVMGRAVPLRDLVPGLSEPIAAVVARAMSPDREARYASAAELAHAFANALEP